jgi:hypothetical protein
VGGPEEVWKESQDKKDSCPQNKTLETRTTETVKPVNYKISLNLFLYIR